MLYDSRFAIRNFGTAREEYFCDHLVRGRPTPIQGSGDQIANIARAGDNAQTIALAVGNRAASGQNFHWRS
jgi:nucleoside-diphosphate-sugar epimerase